MTSRYKRLLPLLVFVALIPSACQPVMPVEMESTEMQSEVAPAPDESQSTQLDSGTSQRLASNNAGAEDGDISTCGDMTFEDWSTWTRVNDDLLRSEGHGNGWVDIYVNDLAEETYLSAGAPYAECSVVAKSKYRGESRDLVIGLGVMVKMPAGYDPDNGDWWYGKFHTSGRYTFEQGMIQECIVCHRGASETDFMFSNEVLQSISELK